MTNSWISAGRSKVGRRRFLGASGAVAAGAAGFALVGCGGDDDDESTATPGGDETPAGGETPGNEAPTTDPGSPAYGGTLRSGTFLDVLGIDPHIEVSVGLTTANRLYAYLGAFSTVQNEFHPQLASNVEQVSDTEYVFTLHEGFKHANVAPVNGRDVTADDVVYSFERFRDLPEAQNNSFFKSVVTNMEAVDNTTFRVTLAAPYADALIELGGTQAAVVPREAVEEYGDLSNQGVGAGPFILEEYVKGERERLVKNPDYFYADDVYLDAYERLVILDGSTLLQAYINDQLDLNGALLTKLDYESLPDDRENYTLPALHYGSLGLNASVPPFDNPMVRKAFYLGMDRQQFIDKLGFGDGLPMGPLSRGLEYWTLSEEELAPYLTVNYDEARALLSAAGVEEGFAMQVQTSAGVQLFIDHANIMVAELNKIGVNAELNLSELGDFLSTKLFAGDFDACVFTHNPYETPKVPLGTYHRNGLGTGSWFHYDNAEISDLYDAQAQELDADTRLQMVKDLQVAILEDSAPMVNFYSPVAYGSYHPRVGGYDPTLRGYQSRRFTEFIRQDG